MKDSNLSSTLKNKIQTARQPSNTNEPTLQDTKEKYQITSEFNIACSDLPNEIDPSDEKLMQLSMKCSQKDGQVKKTYKKLPPFNMPNLSWTEKKIDFRGNTIKYKFGDGNPAEVSLKPENYNGSHGIYEDYVSPDTEKNLYEFLSNPSLKTVIDKCGTILGRDAVDPSIPLIQNLPAILDNQEISMEKMLRINEKTGRKYIDIERITALNSVFNKLDSTLAPSEHEKIKHKCLNSHDLPDFENLYQQFSKFTKSYINTTDGYSASDANNPPPRKF